MKLRIEGNSVLLLVTEAELTRLKGGGEVAEIVHFGAEMQENLRYTLAVAEQAQPVMASFRNNAIAVAITPEQLSAWSEEGQKRIYAKLEVGSTGPLEVAIEKEAETRE
jgi:uncharacterized protein DUF7009